MTSNTTHTISRYSDSDAITRVVAACGFRFTDLDAGRLGVDRAHLDHAVTYGLARVEGVSANPSGRPTTTYVVAS